MERILNWLERRFGRLAFDNLTLVLVAAQAAAFVLTIAKPRFAEMLMLDPYAVRAGQYWRLFSYVFMPVSLSPIWAFFALYWLYTMGTALESHWGAFKYQIFWFSGVAITSCYALLFNVPADNTYLIMSLFLAFATLWPRYQITVFFILPVEVRFLAWLDIGLLALAIYNGYGWGRLVPVLAVANYLLFFGEHLVKLLLGKPTYLNPHVSRPRSNFASEESARPKVRRCAICNITSEDDPNMDFRVCTCAKHEGPTELCITHARNH